MRKPLIVANWKMKPATVLEAKKLFNLVKKGLRKIKNKKIEVVICPPFVYLSNLQLTAHNLQLGAQDCFWKNKEAFTGEISPLMIKKLKVKYVILGHSERRKYLKEDDQMISNKVKAALRAKLKPILCIGETREEREKERFTNVLKFQLESVFKTIDFQDFPSSNLTLAYEPVWTIGAGNFCRPEIAREMLIYIKRILSKHLPTNWKEIKILYGGSVESKNAKLYIDVGFDGLLVGGISLKISEFIKIIKNV